MDHNNQSCELFEKVQPHEQADVVHFGPIIDLVFSDAESNQLSCCARMDSVILK